jgi:hypothetical protein
MPEPIEVTINWPDGAAAPTPDQDPILVPVGQGATVIKWACGTNVSSFTITGLDASVFTPSSGDGTSSPPKKFSTTDANRDTSTTDYTYTITAVHMLGHSASHDPKIENGG